MDDLIALPLHLADERRPGTNRSDGNHTGRRYAVNSRARIVRPRFDKLIIKFMHDFYGNFTVLIFTAVFTMILEKLEWCHDCSRMYE